VILFTSARHSNKKLIKSAIVHLIIAFICIGINSVYSLFGHGVSSPHMTYMFLYPLIGGTVTFSLLHVFYSKVINHSYFRLSYNLYNSGIATLIIGSMLNGVFEIAGTASLYTKAYYAIAFIFILVSIVATVLDVKKKHRLLFLAGSKHKFF
jgi:hypothetical protein